MSGKSILDEQLYEKLLELRNKIAKQKNLPPFVIFQNATLKEMAETKAQTIDALRQIKQVSVSKATKYGKPFLQLISTWKHV